MSANLKFKFAFALLTAFILTSAAFAAGDGVWRPIDDSALARRPLARTVVPSEYRTFALDKEALRSMLDRAPEEFSNSGSEMIIRLPMPDGSLAQFRVYHSLVVEPGLLEKYPELGATYSIQGVDDPSATGRIDFLPTGFHALVLSTDGSVIIDPYAAGDTENYISYLKRNVTPTGKFYCEVGGQDFSSIYNINTDIPDAAPEVTSGTQLRTYRLAVAATNEYAVAVGGNTIAGTLAAQVLIINRVNGVYERDVAIRMVMVANNNLVVYAGDQTCGGVACTAANDPYTNGSGSTMLTENINNLNAVILTANYDIGHVFSTGGGGVAGLQVPCGSTKARGVTGLSNPVGDPFAIDYVAHEMGHQWGGNHTFNGTSGSCSGNRSSTAAYETGSGITIMAYAGICSTQNLAAHSIDTFHVKSLQEIVAYSQTGNGNTCAATTATGNTPPTVPVVGGPYNVPKQTPFVLSATSTDANNDTITYDWQEYDLGASTTAVPNTDASGAMPIFRPYLPSLSGTRYFPSMSFVLANANVPPATTGSYLTGELMPSITRTMNFQVVARDNRVNGGGINSATVVVNVDGNSGPFNVTAPNTAVSWAGNSSQTVTWNVANTTNAPVSAANVKILFSSDGGLTFPTTILASTANDGTETITVPNIATTQGRIKVEGVGNIFFDVSDANFTITAPAVNIRAPFDYDGDDKTDLSIFRPAPGEWWYQKSSNGGNAAAAFGTSTDRIVPGDYTGDGKTDFAFYRPATGQWFVLRSEDLTYYAFPFGNSTDTPVPADFDGDGKTDAAVFRSSTLTWYINKTTGGTDIIGFGATGDKPVPSDYDGDAKADIAIFRPTGASGSEWWVRRSSNGTVVAAAFGTSTDKPVQGDYTGDGKTDFAFWRPTNGNWYVLRSENLTFYAFPFGATGDTPSPGDYDGDNKTDAAVFRSSNSTWYVNRSTAGVLIQTFGIAGDIATPNAYIP